MATISPVHGKKKYEQKYYGHLPTLMRTEFSPSEATVLPTESRISCSWSWVKVTVSAAPAGVRFGGARLVRVGPPVEAERVGALLK